MNDLKVTPIARIYTNWKKYPRKKQQKEEHNEKNTVSSIISSEHHIDILI